MKQFRNYPYTVSENGEVFRIGKTKALKNATLKKGYERVTLSMDGHTQRFQVHRMVAECYIPNPLNKPDINHIDNIPYHNNKNNLEWCTHSENMLHCHRHGRCSNILASNAARDRNVKMTREKLINLLGHRLIEISTSGRTFVTYTCEDCSNIYRHRADTPSIARGGICRSCFIKSNEEDIV